MKKYLVAILISLLMMGISGTTWAKDKTEKPANVVTVAKSGGDYSSIAAALNSITAASSTNPYIIKVMPGIYNESITMKPYVDVVGSGRENTKITATTSAIFTVNGADNSTIENIWVDNSSPIQNGAVGTSAILNDNTSMTIANVKVTIAPVSGVRITNFFGILNKGTSAKLVISNCSISAYDGGGDQNDLWGIGVWSGSDVTVQNCKIETKVASSNSNWQGGITSFNSSAPVKINVRDTVINTEGGRWNGGIEMNYALGGTQVTINNTKITAIAASDASSDSYNYGVRGPRSSSSSLTITNSDISVSGTADEVCAIKPQAGSTDKIGSSLITGSICGTSWIEPYKIVNSWDEDFNPIPNQ